MTRSYAYQSLFILLACSTLAWSQARAQNCAATLPATMGWHNDGSLNFEVSPQVIRSTWQEIVAIGERDTVRSNLAFGWQSFSMTPTTLVPTPTVVLAEYNNSGVDASGMYWDHTLDPFMSSSAEITPTPMCASGYAVAYSPSTGEAYCELVDVNLRNCPTDVGPDKERGCKNEGGMEGNPCSVATGNKFQVEVDYEGHPDSHLTYSRYYNSDATTPLGSHAKQWRGTFDRRLVLSTDLMYAGRYNDVAAIFMIRHDGRVIQFLDSNPIAPKDAATPERLIRIDAATWNFTDADGSIESYQAYNGTAARLVSIRFVDGRKINLTYNGSGYLSTVADEFGHKLTFTYNTAGRVTKFTDPANKSYTYTYNTSAGLLTKITYPDTTFKQYTYGTGVNATSLAGIVDENNTTYASWTYDTSKRATGSQHAGGAEAITIAYNTDGSRTVTDAQGSVRTYQFDLVQNELKFANRLEGGVDEDTSYDANGYVSSRIDRNGVQTTYVHDARGLETSRTEAAGTPKARTITTQWHATLRVPTLFTEAHRTTALTYNALGNLLTRTVTDTLTAQARTWTYTYDTYGRMLTENGPRTDVNDTNTIAYYTCTTGGRCGRPQTLTNAAGHVTTFNTYDVLGQPLTITDPNGVVTTRVYDLRGRLTSQTVGNSTTAIEYWPTGLLKKITLPDATYMQLTYDAAHRLTEISDSEGNRRVYTLDAAGNRIAERLYDPFNVVTQSQTREFDTLNRLWKVIGAAGTSGVTTTLGYDGNDNHTSTDAPLGRQASKTFDVHNRIGQSTDPLAGVTTIEHNALDQITSVSDPRYLSTSYTYNALGDMLQTISPDSGTTTRTFDAKGNLLTQTDARGMTGTYNYDALNRPLTLTYPDQNISFSYDTGTNQKGQLKQITDASGTTVWTYDTRGRVLSRQQSMGVTKTVSYTYDTTSRVATMTLPSGSVILYTYTQGKPTTVKLNGSTTLLSGALYQPFGGTRGWTWGNGALSVREYNLDGMVTDIDSAGLKTYAYDYAARITGISDASNSALNQSFGYDPLDRLSSGTSTSGSQGWAYDANNNRLSQTGAQASTFSVAGNSNRLSSTSGSLVRSYSYDAAGNTTSDGVSTFANNDAGRMVSSTTSSVTTTYAFNVFGERVKKTTGGNTIYFLYDEAGHLVGEYSNSGALIHEIVWLGDTPVAVLKPNGTGVSAFYVHSDHLNTPRRITRPSDNVIVWRWDSDAFGATPANEDPDGDATIFGFNLRFPGQYRDSESGLMYNYFRDYDPQTGRYVQSDPIGLAGGMNPYSYVSANALLRFDPLGLAEIPDNFMGPPAPGDYRSSDMTQTKCGRIPPSPPDVSVNDNMDQAMQQLNPVWFRNQVRNKGPWDYKQFDPTFRDFGNFNFGATGMSFGFSLRNLLREAGRAQIAARTSRPEWGVPGNRFNPNDGRFPYGDDPQDSEQITKGAGYCGCMGKAATVPLF